MKLQNSLVLLSVALSELGIAIPVQDSPRQRLLDGLPLPPNLRKTKTGKPYTPGFKDPLDKAVDTVGDKLDPLPYRNGLGASVLGPWNWERSRQSPDMVRPPSTDHGNMANMRWSFADSHVRIEVRNHLRFCTVMDVYLQLEGRWMDKTNDCERVGQQCRTSLSQHAT